MWAWVVLLYLIALAHNTVHGDPMLLILDHPVVSNPTGGVPVQEYTDLVPMPRVYAADHFVVPPLMPYAMSCATMVLTVPMYRLYWSTVPSRVRVRFYGSTGNGTEAAPGHILHTYTVDASSGSWRVHNNSSNGLMTEGLWDLVLSVPTIDELLDGGCYWVSVMVSLDRDYDPASRRENRMFWVPAQRFSSDGGPNYHIIDETDVLSQGWDTWTPASIETERVIHMTLSTFSLAFRIELGDCGVATELPIIAPPSPGPFAVPPVRSRLAVELMVGIMVVIGMVGLAGYVIYLRRRKRTDNDGGLDAMARAMVLYGGYTSPPADEVGEETSEIPSIALEGGGGRTPVYFEVESRRPRGLVPLINAGADDYLPFDTY